MIKWKPFELHTHTNHSDGDFEVAELVKKCKEIGFSGIALTDHNTISAREEFTKKCLENDLICVNGIEWTTYFGHMSVLDEKGITDWRNVLPDDIDEAIKKIHKNDGIIGIMHPFAVSDPINTGYNWSFKIKDYSLVDYIEVYSRDFPLRKVQTKKAFEFWESLLLKGYKIPAISGRDWHRPDANPACYAYTYFGIEDGETVIDAIKKSSAYVTLGPRIDVDIRDVNNNEVHIGNEICSQKLTIKINIDDSINFENYKRFNVNPKYINIVNNGITIATTQANNIQIIEANVEKGYIRIDVIGDCDGLEEQRIIFTNPIYVY